MRNPTDRVPSANMTTPHDHITTHPEYARTYQHYISHGSTPEDAARLAYEHTRQHLAVTPAAVAPKKGNAGKIVLFAVLGVVGLCVIGGIAAAVNGPSEEKPATSDARSVAPTRGAAKPVPAKPKPGIGVPVNDGNFQFTLKSVQCGATKVGTVLEKKAQGQFCLVTVVVKNVKKDPRTFDASSQKAFGADGAEFGADGAASIYVNENNETFINDINPGNQVQGVLVFDIPKTAKITKLRFHDSAFSGGVEVVAS